MGNRLRGRGGTGKNQSLVSRGRIIIIEGYGLLDPEILSRQSAKVLQPKQTAGLIAALQRR